jgi:hypothetical protein
MGNIWVLSWELNSEVLERIVLRHGEVGVCGGRGDGGRGRGVGRWQ